jgi:histidine triad (HIT) family protein
MGDGHCAFCDVVERGGGALTVYENPDAVVFLDKHPINVGHVLVVPRRHAESFYELDEDSFVGLMLVVRRMASALEAAYRPRKVGMLAAGFDVAHAHIHVLPMYEYHDITSKALLEGRRASPSGEELRTAAGRIRRGLRVEGDGAT